MAINYILLALKTDLVVVIDADTLLAKDAVEKTLPYFNDPKAASVCGFVIPQKIETIWERGRFIEYLLGQCIAKSAQENSGALIVSSGCFSVFKTCLIREFGGFNHGTMAEDMDLTWRLTSQGYRAYYEKDALCFPLEPATGKIFVKQIDRWYRGYLQNIALHSFRNNKKLGMFICGYLLEIILSPLIVLAVAISYPGQFLTTLPLIILFEFTMLSSICVVKGYRMRMFKKTLFSTPAYFVIRWVSIYMFWRSLWKEWIVKDRLSVWNKGH